MSIVPSNKQWKKWSLPSKAGYISCVVAVVGVIIVVIVFLIQTRAAKENQEIRKKEHQILKNGQEEILKEMQRVETTLQDSLMSTYQQGYCLFAINHKEIIIPNKSKLNEDYVLNWSPAKIVEITPEKIAIVLPNIYNRSTRNVIQSNIVSIHRRVGFTTHVWSWSGLEIYIELLSDTEEGIICVIGFRVTPLPQNLFLRKTR